MARHLTRPIRISDGVRQDLRLLKIVWNAATIDEVLHRLVEEHRAEIPAIKKGAAIAEHADTATATTS